MTERELVALLAGVLEAEGVRRGLPFAVVRDFQPTRQGRDLTQPVVYIHAVASAQRGWETKSYSNPEDRAGEVDQHRREVWHTLFQFSARGLPRSTQAIDVLTVARGAFASDNARTAFRAAGVLPLAPGSIRQVWLTNEAAEQEAHPSFDVLVGHSRQMIDPVAKVDVTASDFTPL